MSTRTFTNTMKYATINHIHTLPCPLCRHVESPDIQGQFSSFWALAFIMAPLERSCLPLVSRRRFDIQPVIIRSS
ncbi:hypothetical protein E2C01_059653 [Portunus trituberculatus]|uniref:Uncharacterized protein n=1 Tax=Portunus trituberculatus TaxID=210409 RepID=A0A5B7H798_PORTR|nr:hypothetical protein [Portunus trituberculatus]